MTAIETAGMNHDPDQMTDDFVDNITGYKSQIPKVETQTTGPTSDDAAPDPPEGWDDELRGEPQPDHGAPETEGPTFLDDEPSYEEPPEEGPTSDEEGDDEEGLFAGKYRTPDELEKAYLETTRESSRLARERAEQDRQLQTYQQMIEGMVEQQATEAEPDWPEMSEDEFMQNPVEATKRLVAHRASLEERRRDEQQRLVQQQIEERFVGIRGAFAELIKSEGISEDQYQNLTSYATNHTGVRNLIDSGRFEEAAQFSHLMWQKDHARPQRTEAKRRGQQKRTKAYVEGGRRASRAKAAPGSAKPRIPDEQALRLTSDEELDLMVEHAFNEQGQRMPNEMRLNRR